MVEVPVVPPRRPYTRVKTALVVGLALVAVACLAPLHSGPPTGLGKMTVIEAVGVFAQ